MLRTGRRIVISQFLSIAAVTLCFAAASLAQETPAYLRISIDPETTVYVKLNANEISLAPDAQGLETAKPFKSLKSSHRTAEFPEVDLPIPPKALPAGFSKVSASLLFYTPSSELESIGQGAAGFVFGQFLFYRPQQGGGLWRYSVKMNATAGNSPGAAAVVPLPALQRLTPEFTVKTEKKEVRIAFVIKDGKTELADIARDGKSVEAQLRVIGSNGKVIASAVGPLSKFGFT